MHEMISFFDLPREVRDQILFHHCGNKTIAASKGSHTTLQLGRLVRWTPNSKTGAPLLDTSNRCKDTFPFLCMLKVSRRFYDEAVTMFYSTSDFQFRDLVPFHILVDQLPVRYQKLIRELHLHMPTKEADQWRAMLGVKATYLSGLRKVRISINMGPFKRPRGLDPEEFRLDSSISLSSLQETTISVRYRYAKPGDDAVLEEDAEGIAQGLIDSLREGIKCQNSEKMG